VSRRGAKRCQRRYTHGSVKSQMCGQLISKLRDSRYCPECEAKLKSIEEREKLERENGVRL